tara:strand:- start:414 stop:575 length:162 start_codon:yes stop_codon:yes gene_type:complete
MKVEIEFSAICHITGKEKEEAEDYVAQVLEGLEDTSMIILPETIETRIADEIN